MKVEIKAKFLQYLLNKNQTQGFTKLGLLVRILLYGCVATALSLPFYIRDCQCCRDLMDTACGGRASEAKTYIGSINKGQQASYTEYGTFTDSITDLGLGIATETNDYSYRILSPMVPVQTLKESINSALLFKKSVTMVAQAKNSNMTQYIGAVSVGKIKATNEVTTLAVICEIDRNASLPSTMPTITDKGPECPKGSTPLR